MPKHRNRKIEPARIQDHGSDHLPISKISSRTILVDDLGLRSINARPSLPTYLKQIWQRRDFIRSEGETKALSTGRDTYLGKIWLVLDPLIQISVYALIFGLVLNVSRGIDNFIGYLILGVIFFKFFSTGITGGSGLIRSSRQLISSFRFPRACLPLSAIYRQFIDNLVPAAVAIVLAIASQLSEPRHWTVIFVIPLYLLLHIFILGVTFFVSRATASVPDLKSVVSMISRALFFVSGIFFSVERFDFNPILQQIMLANPIYQFLKAVRDCVLYGNVPEMATWLYLTGWSLSLAIIGFLYFWSGEERYIEFK